MNKLKRKIIKYFVLCAFLISLLESAWDSTFLDIISPLLLLNADTSVVLFGAFFYFFVTFAIFLLYAYVFYCLVNKAVKQESERQLSERNMHYSSICHDLKTPMTSVLGFAAALREDRIKPEEQKEIFNIIYEKSGYMNELVESLFTYSKLNTDDYSLSFKNVDLCPIVRNLAAINYDEFEKKQIDLEIKIPKEPIICFVDEKEIKRSINNLIVNSYKHNENGAKVMIQIYRRKKEVYIEVADNGVAITKEQERVLFEPFECGDDARTSGNGNGLGLTISKIIIEKHYGEIYINHSISGYTKGFVIKLSAI